MTQQQKFGGEIAYYHLEDWWLETFTDEERAFIRNRYSPISTGTAQAVDRGHIHYSTMDDPTQFLYVLGSWFLHKEDDPTIRQRIVAKANELATQNNFQRPGYLNGRHFTTYIEEVKQLKREDRLEEAKALLEQLVVIVRTESSLKDCQTPTWYEHHLGIVERKLARRK